MTIGPELLENWKQGIGELRARRWWHAHEAWERGWKSLPPAHKRHLQALIQAVGAFHLLEKGRVRPALALCAAARGKLSHTPPDLFPRVEIPGLASALARIEAAPGNWLAIALSLDAKIEHGR